MSNRDLNLFPEDQTGEQLWQWLNLGFDLNLACEVEFSLIFTNKEEALNYANILLENNQKISFTPYDSHETHPWEVTAYPTMPLSHHNISGYQELLESYLPENALFDGWYCSQYAE